MTHLLRFTGNLSRGEFDARCGRHKRWYHSYYFDNGYQVRGDYNMGADVLDYGFPKSMAGMRVLDLGTGAGWFAHHFEQLGAEVFTVDARGYCDFDVYGRFYYPVADSEGKPPDRVDEDGNEIYDSPVSGAFWLMKEMLGSRVRFRNSRIYDIRPEMFGGRLFDLVFMGAMLSHLRDPIGALMAARRLCKGEIVATAPVVLGEPEGQMVPLQYLPYTSISTFSWWLPNEACFRHWFQAAGFRDVDVKQQLTLRCDVERYNDTGRLINGDQTLRLGRAKA